MSGMRRNIAIVRTIYVRLTAECDEVAMLYVFGSPAYHTVTSSRHMALGALYEATITYGRMRTECTRWDNGLVRGGLQPSGETTDARL